MENSEQQFYELDDAGQPVAQQASVQTTGQKASGGKPWLRYIIVVLILIVVGLLAIWGVRALLSPDIDEVTDEEMNEAYELVQHDLEECEEDEEPALCKDRVWINAAQEMNEPSLCLEADDLDLAYNCVFDIAYDRLDRDQCELIEDEERQITCVDTILFDIYVENLYYGNCKLLRDPLLVERCESRLEAIIIDAGLCEEYGVREALCLEEETKNDIVRGGDPNGCTGLTTYGSETDCMEEFHATDLDDDGLSLYEEYYAGTSDDSADTDGDGLSDGEEVNEYGTDPTNADSDGDGYADGEEVENGFDPLGE